MSFLALKELAVALWDVIVKHPGWALSAVLALALGVQTARLHWAQHELETFKAKQEKLVHEKQAAADRLADELIIAQAQAMATTEKTVTVYRDRIIHAPVTTTCGPVVRDAVGGVRDILGSGSPAPAGRPAR